MVVKFGDFVSNKTKKFNPLSSNDVFECIELEHLSSNDGFLNGTVKSDKQKSIKNTFSNGNVLYGKLRPYLRKYYFADFPGVCSSEIWVLSPKNKDLSPYFLYFLVQSERFNNYVNLTTGTKMPRADWEHVKKFKFTLPSFEQQNKFAVFLLALERRIKYQKDKVDALKEQKKGYQQRVFNRELVFTDDNGNAYPEWEEKKLGEMLDLCQNGISLTQNLDKKGYPVTRIETISAGKINMSKVGYVDTDISVINYLMKTDDILFSNINSIEHIGKTAIVTSNIPELYHGMNLLRFRTKKNNSGRYLFYYLNTSPARNYFRMIANKAVSQASINQTEVAKTLIPVPCFSEQEKIAEFFSSLDENIELNERKLELLKEQKKGYLQGIFG